MRITDVFPSVLVTVVVSDVLNVSSATGGILNVAEAEICRATEASAGSRGVSQ